MQQTIENYHKQLSFYTDSFYDVEIYQNVNNNLEQRLTYYHLQKLQKQQLIKLIKLEDRTYPIYFKLQSSFEQYHNKDSSLDETFNMKNYNNYFNIFPIYNCIRLNIVLNRYKV
ncbi:unnamed protein product [Paramecium primaurelia]|uniref:Uncharacterized protein n=1 Tax=Paramecium primaurelia TaxID=5886 RepID=A0A8S1M513_PARPR|nr:unnamed protein product [Paramecium primaurelia]